VRLELLILSYNKFFDWVYCVGKVGISHAHKKKQFGCRGLTQTTLHSSLTKKGATMSGVQVRTQDHLRSKVRKKLEPLIEDQRLLNRSLVSEMAEHHKARKYNETIEKKLQKLNNLPRNKDLAPVDFSKKDKKEWDKLYAMQLRIASYPFSVKNVEAFMKFCNSSGGFEIC